MPWCYIDDRFPEHPKVLLAGGDAGWLWLCAYAYVNRNLTDGYIPKAVIPRISDRRNPHKLAKVLVRVGLWEDKDDAYYMHDYDQFNQTASMALAKKNERSERARKAAAARWGNADAMQDACTEHADSDAQAMQDALLTPMLGDAPLPQPPTPPPTPLLKSPSLEPLGSSQDEGTGGEKSNGVKPLQQPLAEAVAAACKGNQREFVKAEAVVVVEHLTRFVDKRLVEEAIGQAKETGANLPRWFLPAVRSRAEAYGIAVPLLPALEKAKS